MKKSRIKALLSLTLVLTILSGCTTAGAVAAGGASDAEHLTLQTEPPVTTAPVESLPPETDRVIPPATEPAVTKPPKIGKDEALNIALTHAGVLESRISDREIGLDKENGVVFYEVSFDADGWEYEYDIEAYTGEILRSEAEPPEVKETKPAVTEPPATEPAVTKPQKIGKDEALNIALTHAGVLESHISDREIELDKENGVVFYEVSFDADGWEYEYDIEAYTGEILRSEAEPPEVKETKPVVTEPVVTEPAVTEPPTTEPAVTKPQKIGKDEALNIALTHAGVLESRISDREIELDKENGVVFYEVSFDADGWEYEYDIEAYTGQVLQCEKEPKD